MLADKGSDSDAIRRQIAAAGAAPNIPPEINRRWTPCFSPVLYHGRNATRDDRLATNFLAAVCLDAIISYW